MIKIGGFGKIYSPDSSSTRLGEADSRSVLRTDVLMSCQANKSYKSEQIEQIRQIIIFRLQISKRNI